MKTLGKFIGVFVVVGFLVMVCFGCSSDSGSSTPSNLSTRVNVLVAENGTLTPVVQGAGERTVSATDQSWEYTLTLENVSDEVVWYTDRPGRDSGTEKPCKPILLCGLACMVTYLQMLFWMAT